MHISDRNNTVWIRVIREIGFLALGVVVAAVLVALVVAVAAVEKARYVFQYGLFLVGCWAAGRAIWYLYREVSGQGPEEKTNSTLTAPGRVPKG